MTKITARPELTNLEVGHPTQTKTNFKKIKKNTSTTYEDDEGGKQHE